MKLTRYLLFIATITLVSFKLYHLGKIDFDIDILNRQLTPVKKFIKPRSTIGLYENYNYSAIAMSAEYVLAPVIVIERAEADTMLLIQSQRAGVKAFPGYRSIVQQQDGDRVISLITRYR